MAKNTISQLDLVLLGRRGLTARLGSVEGQVRRLTTGAGGDGTPVVVQDLRPNLFTNSSFEFFDRNSTRPQDWTSVSAVLSVGSAGSDGTNTVKLPGGASISQKPISGGVVPQCSVVVSVAARTDFSGQKIGIGITHAPGFQAGAVMRLDLQGNVMQTDDVPPDGNWYRFYRSFILTGGANVTATIAQAGTGTLEVDAAKFEKEDGVASWLEPTAYITADWGAATHIRNLSAENIITGTLVVGGSISTNPRISVKDGSDVEIVTIGAPNGGFYGIEILGAAGFRISGTGSAEVLGGGSVNVKGGGSMRVEGGGDITVDGGNVNIIDGSLNVSTAGGAIYVQGGGGLVIGDGGGILIDGGGDLTMNSGSSASIGGTLDVSGNTTIGGTLGITGTTTIGGNTTIGGTTTIGGDTDIGGDIVISGTAVIEGGLLRVGGATGKRIVWGASGMEAYDAADNRRMFLDVDTTTWRFFGENSIVLEADGSLRAGELAWVDSAGFWATDHLGNAAFGVSGLDLHLWGGMNLDAGDVLLGDSNSYVLWDASESKIFMDGTLSAAGGQVLIGDQGASFAAGPNNANQLKWQLDPGDPSTTVSQMYTFDTAPFGYQTTTVLRTIGGTYMDGWNTTTVIETFANGSPMNAWTRMVMSVNQNYPDVSGITFSVNGLEKFNVHSTGASVLSGNFNVQQGFVGTHPSYGNTYSAFWRANQDYSLLTNNTHTFVNAPDAGGTVYLRSANVTRASANATGFFVGNQAARYFMDDGTYTRYKGNFVVDGDLYCNSQWISTKLGYLNQSVLTTAHPTFSNVTISGVGALWGTITNQGLLTTSQPTFNTVSTSNWFRSSGSSGWLNTTHGGGWYMFDTWIRNYQAHPVWIGGGTTQAQFQGSEVRVHYANDAGADNGNTMTQYWGGGKFNFFNNRSGVNVMSLWADTGVARVGIRSDSPTHELTVGVGGAAKPGGGSWATTSDIRAKTVLGGYEYGLAEVKRLDVVRYEYNGLASMPAGERHVGFVAQHVQEVIPEAVTPVLGKLHPDDEHETEILTMSNDAIFYALVNSVKELAEIVDELRARLDG